MRNTLYPLAACFVLASCTQEVPKCSDSATQETLTQIIVAQIDPGKKLTEQQIRENVKIDSPLATSLDKDIKKYTCEAQGGFFHQYTLPLQYSSQLDDKDQHIVTITGVQQVDWLTLQAVTAEFLDAGNQAASNNGSTPAVAKAQQPPAIHADYAKHVGEHPAELLDDPIVAAKFKEVVGEDFEDFVSGLSVSTVMEIKNGYYFGSGCAPHVCSIEESAFAVSTTTQKIVAARLIDGESIKLYGASSASALPAPLRDWYQERSPD